MKFPNLPLDRVKFIVNEQEKIVVCYMAPHDIDTYVNKIIRKNIKGGHWWYPFCKVSECLQKNSYRVSAKTRCREGDEFDVEKGKKICLRKLQNRILKALFNGLKKHYFNILTMGEQDLLLSTYAQQKIVENKNYILGYKEIPCATCQRIHLTDYYCVKCNVDNKYAKYKNVNGE